MQSRNLLHPAASHFYRRLTLVLVAIAMVFNTAPLCAARDAPSPATAMAGCGDMAGDREGQHEEHREMGSLACHFCAVPLGMLSALDPPAPWLASDPDVQPVRHLTGALIEPPTPPPRIANAYRNSNNQWS